MDCIILIERKFLIPILPNSDMKAKGFSFPFASASTSDPEEGFRFCFLGHICKILFFSLKYTHSEKIYFFRGWVYLPKIHIVLKVKNVLDTWFHHKRISRRILGCPKNTFFGISNVTFHFPMYTPIVLTPLKRCSKGGGVGRFL